MATTTNYGWTTPDDTALVKDGASAIRSLGSSVDTTVKNLNPETTLGDISYRSSTSNTNTRLAIGTTGQVLTVSGGVPAWATAASGGMTSIASGNLSGSEVSITSISQSYNDLLLVIRNYEPATDGTNAFIRFNSDATTNYRTVESFSSSVGGTPNDERIGVSYDADNAVNDGVIVVRIWDYANTSHNKHCTTWAINNNNTTTTSLSFRNNMGAYYKNDAITSIQIFNGTGNFSAGTYVLYGVK